MTSFNRLVATLLCGAIAVSLPVPLQAQSQAACDAAIDKLQKDTAQLGKDLDADVKEFVKSEYADETLKGVRNHFKNKPAVGAAFDLKDKWDSFTSWVEETKRARVTMDDLGKCINTKGCSLIEFAKRQNELIAKWIQKLGDEGLSAAAERVNKQASIIRNFADRTLNTATNGIFDTVQKCETRIEQQANTNTSTSQPARPNAPNTPPASNGGGGGHAGALIGVLGAAIGGGLAYGYYSKTQEELASTTGGGGSSTGGGSSSGGGTSTTTTYRATVDQRSCTGPGTQEPCTNATDTGGSCGPVNFTFTVSGGTVRGCANWLSGSVSSNGAFTGNYNGSCGTTPGPAVSGSLPGTISGTSSCRGNTYNIRMTITRQ